MIGDDEHNEREGFAIFIIFLGTLALIAFLLFNSYTHGIMFAKTLECEQGEYKISFDTPVADDEFKIQPDGSWATCGLYIKDDTIIYEDDDILIYEDNLSLAKTLSIDDRPNTSSTSISTGREPDYVFTFALSGEPLPYNPDDYLCYNGDDIINCPSDSLTNLKGQSFFIVK